MRDRGRGGDGGRDWGNIDWSNIDLSGFGRGGDRLTGPSRRFVILAIVIFLVLLIPVLIGPFVSFLTDLLWFRSLGLESVYLRRFTAAFYAFLVFGGVFFVLALPNVYFALRPQMPRVVVDAERRRRGAVSTTLRFMWLLLIPAFFFGLAGGDEWDMLLRWLNQVPFGATDPVFGRDIGFYFFTLPVLEFVRGWLLVAIIVIAIGVVTLYLTRGVIGVATGSLASADLRVAGRTALALARPARAHLSVLGGLFLALIAAGYLIDQFELLFRQEAVLVGVGYTSINARLPALTILSALVGLAALACFGKALRQFYSFTDVDIDRYQVAGKEQSMMLSARELSANAVPAQTWVNRHLVYTHGSGVVATQVGAVAPDGRPVFAVKDIPPTGEPKIDQPRIYFGEITSDYVIVDTLQDEFDGTDRGTSATNFKGNGGVGVGSLWDRILFSARLGDLNLLISNQITSQR